MGYFLVRTPSGEQMQVSSLDGHDDCEVLEEGVSEPRVAGCYRENGSWKVDKEVARKVAVDNMSVSQLRERLLVLENVVAALKDRLSKAGL